MTNPVDEADVVEADEWANFFGVDKQTAMPAIAEESPRQETQHNALNVLLPVALLLVAIFGWYALSPEQQTTPSGTPVQEMPTVAPQYAESLFTDIGSNGQITVTAEDLEVLTNKSLRESRMPQMVPVTDIRLTGTTLPEITAAFNTAWQSGDQDATYLYGAMILENATSGVPEAANTIYSYVYGWEVSIKGSAETGDPIATLTYNWVLNAAHALTALGEYNVANDLYVHVMLHPQLETNPRLYNDMLTDLGEDLHVARANLNREQASAGQEPSTAPYQVSQPSPVPAETIAGTDFAELKPHAQPESLGNEDFLAAPLMGEDDGTVLIMSPATVVIMIRDVNEWLQGDHTGASYNVTGREFVRIEWLGKVYTTPFLLLHMNEVRGNQTFSHNFLLLHEFSDTNLIINLLTKGSDGLETFADMLTTSTNYLHLSE